MPGFTELIVILVILVIIFGANKLPELGEAIGRAARNFKRARASRDDIVVSSPPASERHSAEGPGRAEPKAEDPGDEPSGRAKGPG